MSFLKFLSKSAAVWIFSKLHTESFKGYTKNLFWLIATVRETAS